MRRRITIVITAALTLLATEFVVWSMKDQLSVYYLDVIEKKRDCLANVAEPPEILLFGSSRVTYGMVPAVFEAETGMRTFNFGIPGAKVGEWRLLAKEVIKSTRPRLIVLGINASAIRGDYLPVMASRDLFSFADFCEYTFDYGWSTSLAGHFMGRNVLSYWSAWHHSYEIKMFSQELFVDFFPKHAQAARERRELVFLNMPSDGYETPRMRGDRIYNLAERMELFGDGDVQRPGPPPFNPDAPAVEMLDLFLAELRESGANVLVCYIPNSPRTESDWSEVEPAMRSLIAGLCRQHEITFLDAPQTEIPRTNADFLIDVHVGTSFAKNFSERTARHAVRFGMTGRNHRRVAFDPSEDGNRP